MQGNIIRHEDYLSPTAAIFLMTQHNMVLRDYNAFEEDDVTLVWWSSRCHVFHYWSNGTLKGIWNNGFINKRAYFPMPKSPHILRDILFTKDFEKSEAGEYRSNTAICEIMELTAQSHFECEDIFHVGNHLVHVSERPDLMNCHNTPIKSTLQEEAQASLAEETAKTTTKEQCWNCRTVGLTCIPFITPMGNSIYVCLRCHEALTELITTKEEQGRKYDSEKLRWYLLPWDALEEVVRVLTYGAQKYAPNNWKKVEPFYDRYSAALMRHFKADQVGEICDEESGLHHMAQVACNALFLLWFSLQEER